jgi:hypothetical protein
LSCVYYRYAKRAAARSSRSKLKKAASDTRTSLQTFYFQKNFDFLLFLLKKCCLAIDLQRPEDEDDDEDNYINNINSKTIHNNKNIDDGRNDFFFSKWL